MDYFDWYAAYLHRTCPVVDAHLDLVTEVYRRRQAGERGILNKYYKKEFHRSGVNLVFASLFLGRDELEDCKENGKFPKGAILKKSMEMLAAFYADMEETKGQIQLVTDRESLYRVITKRSFSRYHKTGVLLYLEGLDMLEGEPELLRCFYAMGVRGAALTWNQRPGLVNEFAVGVSVDRGSLFEVKKDEGDREADREKRNKETEREKAETECSVEMSGSETITDKGVEALLLMEKLGIFVDSSHLSRQSAWLLPSFTKKPFAATHSNAEALRAHPRNLTDEEIKEIADRGGVIGVNSYRKFVLGDDRDDKRCDSRGNEQSICKSDLDLFCDHIMYLMKRAGENYVGLGLDLGEGCIFTGYKELPKVTAGLLRRGCSVEAVKKVLGGNWVRYLIDILQ